MDRQEQDALYLEARAAPAAAIRRLARGYEADPDRLNDMARSRENTNRRLTRAVVIGAIAFTAALLYNVYTLDQPWIRIGQAWTLAVIVYLFGPAFERSKGLSGGEPCAEFLMRQHAERREAFLRLRNRLFLLVPGIAACWWGARGLAMAHPPVAGPPAALFPMAALGLCLIWFAFGKAAEKAAQDRDEISRSLGRPQE